MARKGARVPLNAYLNGRLVGRLRRETSGAIDFQYDQSWLDWEYTFPVSLSLPLREDRYVGDPVIAVFDNLLPDNNDIRVRVAQRAHADGVDPYSLLAAIGRDCVGALQFLPEGDEPGMAGELKGKPVNDADIARKLSDLAEAPLGVGEDKEFRISIPGAQDKTAFLNWNGKWHIPHGTTATTHIFKPQIGQRGNYDLTHSVENEHMCLEVLGALGLPAAKTRIADFDGTRALVIERFDREWTSDGRLLRVPQEDCCQSLSVPPSRKYQSDHGPGMLELFEFLKGSDDPAHDQMIFLTAQIAFWILGAPDGHAKNFSVFLHPGGGFELTPLYDVMSAQPLYDRKQIQKKAFRFAMSVGNNRHFQIHGILPRHFLQTAKRAGLPEGAATMALDQIAESLPGAIDHVSNALPADFPPDVRDAISEGALKRREALV
jgi:serine/threonine-protein kinase HipA